MPQALTLHRQATPLLSVRSWHNKGPDSLAGTSAHDTIEIAWSEAGGAPEYAVGKQEWTVRPGYVVVVPPHVEHWSRIAPGGQASVLGLDASVLDEVGDAMNVRAELQPLLTAARPQLLVLGRLILAEATGQTVGHDIAVDALTEALAVALLRAEPQPTGEGGERAPSDLRIRRAVAFIEASYGTPLSLEAIATVAGMSRFHFGRLFATQTGKSPYRYLVDVRLSHAATLLKDAHVSVTEAALTVGFNDLGRFARAFRARFGVSPSEALAASRPRTIAPRENARLGA